jgi:DM4/DM12 family
LNLVLTIPLNDPTYSISMGFFLEGNYDLPPYNSQAIYTQPWQQLLALAENSKKARRSSRATVYRAVEGLLERVGRLPGKVCLLRSICEAAAWPVDHDGLIGELVHTILTYANFKFVKILKQYI